MCSLSVCVHRDEALPSSHQESPSACRNPLHHQDELTKTAAALPISIHHLFSLTLCLQPKFTSDTSEFFFSFLFFGFIQSFFCLWSRTQRINLPDVGGPGIVLLLSGEKKQSNLTRTCKFSSFNVLTYSFFSTNCVSDLLHIRRNPSLCNISSYFCEVVMWTQTLDKLFGLFL